jgi:hypothetical protein
LHSRVVSGLTISINGLRLRLTVVGSLVYIIVGYHCNLLF